jgi:tetratricopeptide (TPR) repeat protein
MKRLAFVGICLSLGLSVAIPAFAQSGENAEWTAIEDMRDARRRAELLEKFIKDRPSSGRRPDADFMLVDFYLQNKDYAKIMQHAEGFRTNLPTADNGSKTKMYTQAMIAAASLSSPNIPKTVEFGGYALQADPNNVTVLVFLAGNGLPDPAKATEYATKAITLPRPATMTEEIYARNMARMHGIVAVPLFSQQKFAEAQEHLAVALKANPRDHTNQYRFGFASVNLSIAAAGDAQTANTALLKAMTEKPTNQAAADEAKAKMEASSKKALEHRDIAIEAFAKAVAITGPMSQQAKDLLDKLYTNKAGSLEGEEQLIAEKKKELGL